VFFNVEKKCGIGGNFAETSKLILSNCCNFAKL